MRPPRSAALALSVLLLPVPTLAAQVCDAYCESIKRAINNAEKARAAPTYVPPRPTDRARPPSAGAQSGEDLKSSAQKMQEAAEREVRAWQEEHRERADALRRSVEFYREKIYSEQPTPRTDSINYVDAGEHPFALTDADLANYGASAGLAFFDYWLYRAKVGATKAGEDKEIQALLEQAYATLQICYKLTRSDQCASILIRIGQLIPDGDNYHAIRDFIESVGEPIDYHSLDWTKIHGGNLNAHWDAIARQGAAIRRQREEAERARREAEARAVAAREAERAALVTSLPPRSVEVAYEIASRINDYHKNMGAPYYDLWKPLPAAAADSLVASARKFVERYPSPYKFKDPDPKKLAALRAAAALPGCDKGNVVDCRPLLAAVNALADVGILDEMTYAQADLAAIECHAHPTPTICALAGEAAGYEGGGAMDVRDHSVQVTKVAYLAAACVDPKNQAPHETHCGDLVTRMNRGEFGWIDEMLIKNLRYMACIHDPKTACTNLDP